MDEYNNPKLLEQVIFKLIKENLGKIQNTNPTNLGIYQILKILYEKANIKELGIFIAIAENQPLKAETLVKIVENNISKSTVYRKLDEYEQLSLVKKDKIKYLYLGDELKTLEILAEISKLMK